MKKPVNPLVKGIGALVDAYKSWSHITKQKLPDLTQPDTTPTAAPENAQESVSPSETTGQASQNANTGEASPVSHKCVEAASPSEKPSQAPASPQIPRLDATTFAELTQIIRQRNMSMAENLQAGLQESTAEHEEDRRRRKQENAERTRLFEERMIVVIQANAERATQRKKEIETRIQENAIRITQLDSERQRIRQMNLDKVQGRLDEITGALQATRNAVTTFESERKRLEAEIGKLSTSPSGTSQGKIEAIQTRIVQFETQIQQNAIKIAQFESERTNLRKVDPDQMARRMAEIDRIMGEITLNNEAMSEERDIVVRALVSQPRGQIQESQTPLSMADYDKHKQEQRSVAQKEADHRDQVVEEQRMRILERKAQIAETNRRRAAEIEEQRERNLASRQQRKPGA